jgi:phage head maturation protease
MFPENTKEIEISTEEEEALSNFSFVRAVKKENAWLLEVLGVPFGSPQQRDSDGQWFDSSTKFHLDKFPNPPAVYYHGFNSSNQPEGEPVFIGRTLSIRKSREGLWFDIELDPSVEEAKRVWEAAQVGQARASTGSIAHLVRVAKNGHIKVWPIAEISLFEISSGKRPANPYAVVIPFTEKLYAKAGLEFPEEIANSDIIPKDEIGSKGEQQSEPMPEENCSKEQLSNRSKKHMEIEEIQKLVEQSVAQALASKEEQLQRERQQQEEIEAKIQAALKSQREELEAEHKKQLAEAAVSRRLPTEMPYVNKFANLSKYDDSEIADLALIAGILQAAKAANRGFGPSEELRKAIAIRIADSSEGEQFSAVRNVMQSLHMPIKADELNRSTLANYGDEWISVAYSTQLWEKIRLETEIVANIPTVVVPQGAESVVIPIETTSPTFFKVAQASSQDSNPGRVTPTMVTSRRGTGQVQLNVSKLGAAVNYTGELEEDSLIPWAAELRRDLIAEAAEVLEHCVIDGDTATAANTNINNIAGTPTGNEAYLLFDGFRKLALVTNPANSRDAGTLGVNDFLETVKLMGLGGRNAHDKTKVSFILDMSTHWKTLELPEVKTRDVFAAPTIENGLLTNIFGYKVYGSANMHRANQHPSYGLRANANGMVDLNTPSNNTKGAILAVRWDQWRLGMKRRISFEIDRDPLSDSTLIVCMMRVGLLSRDNEASAISYNVGL